MFFEPGAGDHAVASGVEVLEIDGASSDVGEAEPRALGITPDGTHDGHSGGASTSITRLFFRSRSGHGCRPRYIRTHRARGVMPRLAADCSTQALSFILHWR